MKAVVHRGICPLMSDPMRNCERVDEALFGMTVEVVERTTPSYWLVRTHYGYEGYANIRELAIGDDWAEEWAALPKRVVLHKHTCDVLAEPAFQSWPLATLPLGAVVAVHGEAEDGWQPVALPDGQEGYTRSSFLDEYYEKPPLAAQDTLRRRIVDAALRYQGAPYRWGGKTPWGVDCSGLASMAYLLNGIVIHRDASMKEGFPIHPIPREELRPADLLYLPGHVAMYLGEGKYLHATGRAGDDGFAINSLDPAAPDYRADVDQGITAMGSYF